MFQKINDFFATQKNSKLLKEISGKYIENINSLENEIKTLSKEAIRIKQEQQQAAKKAQKSQSKSQQKPQPRVNVKDQLSRAAKDYSRRETSFNEGTEHQFAKPVEFIKRDIEVPETILVGELAKLMFIKGGEVVKVLMSMGVAASINDSIDQYYLIYGYNK